MGMGLAENKALHNKDVLGIVKLAFLALKNVKHTLNLIYCTLPYVMFNRHSGAADVISNFANSKNQYRKG